MNKNNSSSLADMLLWTRKRTYFVLYDTFPSAMPNKSKSNTFTSKKAFLEPTCHHYNSFGMNLSVPFNAICGLVNTRNV